MAKIYIRRKEPGKGWRQRMMWPKVSNEEHRRRVRECGLEGYWRRR